MEQSKQDQIFSVDSETGVYWYGEKIVRNNLLIKMIIGLIKAK